MKTIPKPEGEWANSNIPLDINGKPMKSTSSKMGALAFQDEKDRNNLRAAAQLRKGGKK